MDVKDFFSSRFKRKLVKKSIIEKLQSKIDKYISRTTLIKRNQSVAIFRWMNYIDDSHFYQILVIIMIVGNSIVLAMDKANIDRERINIIYLSNNIFYGFFASELVMKLLSQGFKFYLRDHYNWLDCFIIAVSSVDIALENTVY